MSRGTRGKVSRPSRTARTRTLSSVRPSSQSKKRGSVPAGKSVRNRSRCSVVRAIAGEEAHHLRETGEDRELPAERVPAK